MDAWTGWQEVNVTGLLLGVLQGIFEWLPVSSEGIVAFVYSLTDQGTFNDAVHFALWLHIGTAPTAVIVFRREVAAVLEDVFMRPRNMTARTRFLLVATLVSGALGLPILIFVQEIGMFAGSVSMVVIGLLMALTGLVQLKGQTRTIRPVEKLKAIDGVIAGLAQGLAVLPGLSRSGLTIASLVGMGLDRRDALTLSFLMGVPASIGASAYVLMSSAVTISANTILASVIAFLTGMVTIKVMLVFAQRVNMGWFVLVTGLLMAGGGVLNTLA